MAPLDQEQSARQSTSTSVASTRRWSPPFGSTKVLAVECVRGTSKAEDWSEGLLQCGDIVEEIEIAQVILRAPFRDGNSGVQKKLHICYRNKMSSIRVRVRRGEGNDSVEFNARIVPDGRKKNKYVLSAIDDPNYAVVFSDRTESECLRLKGLENKSSRRLATWFEVAMAGGDWVPCLFSQIIDIEPSRHPSWRLQTKPPTALAT